MRGLNEIKEKMKERDQRLRERTIGKRVATLINPVTLTALIILTTTAQASITENTTITITPTEITSLTTRIYTNNDSKNLQREIDMEGDNNSYINAWEIIKYERMQQRCMKGEEAPWTIKNATRERRINTHTISQRALGRINPEKKITTKSEITTTHPQGERIEITIKKPENETIIMVKKEIKIERIRPINTTILKTDDYQMIKPQNNTTITLLLKKERNIERTTTNQKNTEDESVKNSREKREVEEVKKERETALLITASIFITITTLLIALYKKL
ncbi:hypothetical protein FHEFKHOI_01848 [Candidatus Methanoperedenaceae archaeon GB50]|nr:hypothetical protein FHEFKHOI_01848 [Candidatus Methanoperedenaceae archaeon GB50]CAD7780224.1 MAG: hypothetical protein KBONHNOK_01438 [Candidatus Methanoperedenaceae archaeon GB50]